MEFFRVAQSWLEVASAVGGLQEVVAVILGGISMWYNDKFKMSALISLFYFIKPGAEDDNNDDDDDVQPVST